MYELDQLDKDILMILQKGIPITSRPYQVMADMIGDVSEDEVIGRIARLKTEHIIRRMSGFFNSHALGYVSVLVAVRPKENCFDEAVQVINRYPGITHNYERSHDFCIWFTLIAINRATMNKILDDIEASPYVGNMLRFEMSRRYKIDVTFALNEGEKNDQSLNRNG